MTGIGNGMRANGQRLAPEHSMHEFQIGFIGLRRGVRLPLESHSSQQIEGLADASVMQLLSKKARRERSVIRLASRPIVSGVGRIHMIGHRRTVCVRVCVCVLCIQMM